MDILNSNNEYLLSFLGSIIIPKSKLICLYYERELIYFSPYHCGWDAVMVSIVKDRILWLLIVKKECDFYLGLAYFRRRIISNMVLMIENVEFQLLWSCDY